MHKLWKLLMIGVAFIFIQGCNADNDNVSAPPENAPQEEEEELTKTDTPQNEDGTLFNFSSFDLDIEYDKNQSFDVSYENEADGEMEAEIKDQVNNTLLQGDEAFERLRPIFQELTFDQSTTDEQVIEEVLRAFHLQSDYKKFELEIEYSDGTEKEYKSL